MLLLHDTPVLDLDLDLDLVRVGAVAEPRPFGVDSLVVNLEQLYM